MVKLKGGEQVVAAISLADLTQLNLVVDGDVILLINDPEIIMMTDPESYQYSSRNCLAGRVMRIQTDGIAVSTNMLQCRFKPYGVSRTEYGARNISYVPYALHRTPHLDICYGHLQKIIELCKAVPLASCRRFFVHACFFDGECACLGRDLYCYERVRSEEPGRHR